MRVLICGCGYVGATLGLLLNAGGHEVFGLRRDPSKLPPGITPIRADLSETLSPQALPTHLAAVVYAVSPDEGRDDAYRLAYVDGLRNLLAALERIGSVRRLLFVSSTGVYGQTAGEWVDEDSPAEPQSSSGKRLLEGERVLWESNIVERVVLRLGGIYGPGREDAIERALVAPTGDPPQYTNRIHRDDCAGALLHLLTLPNPDPLYLGVDNDPADRRTIAAWLLRPPRRKAGKPPNPSKDPPRPLQQTLLQRKALASGYAFRYPTFAKASPPSSTEARRMSDPTPLHRVGGYGIKSGMKARGHRFG
jgi:nucleoside-diphosphate-sugar epimerase